MRLVPADRLVINPDRGLRNLPAEVAMAELRAMVAGTARVRELVAAPAAADTVLRPAATR